MSQTFTIFVSKSPYDSANAESASAFCKAAIKSGFKISQVFFYQQGVHNASALIESTSDEISFK